MAYGVFRALGAGWLDKHFQTKLELFKHEQQKEIEQLRRDINSEFSRISKVHQKEFEVLPQAWQLMHIAQGYVADLVARLRFFPDFDRMTEPQFEEFVQSCPLSPVQRQELRDAHNRWAYYTNTIRWIDLRQARSAQIALGNCLALNSIFMTEDLRQQFKQINQDIATIIVNEESDHRTGGARFSEETQALWRGMTTALPLLEAAVQRRLRYDVA